MQPHAYYEAPPCAPARLGPYQFIATPPIQLILDAICSLLVVGGTAAPGIRQLADLSGVSRGLVTDCLRQLAGDGWIAYDGRLITLLRDPDHVDDDAIDQVIDRPDDKPIDHLIDHSAQVIDQVIDHLGANGARRVLVPEMAICESDRSPDRSRRPNSIPPYNPPMEYIYITAAAAAVTKSSTTGGSGGEASADQCADHPAAATMRQYGAAPRIVAEALAARPDYTPDQVHALWAWCEQRRAQRPTLGAGVFFSALREGQLAPAAPAAVDWAAYKRKEAAALAAPPDEHPPADLAAATLRARQLAPDASDDEVAVMAADLVEKASEQAVLEWLAERRARQATLDALERHRRQVRR